MKAQNKVLVIPQKTICLLLLIAGAFFCNLALAQDGQLDITFGDSGKVLTGFGGIYTSAFGYGMVVQPDGKIVVAGGAWDGNYYDFGLIRYNGDGIVDNTFGIGGNTTLDFFGLSDLILAMAIQADGKIVVAGYAQTISDYDFALARYNVDGSLDDSFGSDGLVTTDIQTNNVDVILAIGIQTDNKIVVAGYVDDGPGRYFALARYHNNGTLDNSFDGDGKVTIDFGGDLDNSNAIAIQVDGKIVVAGRTNGNSDEDFALARLNCDGSLDNTFGSDGKVVTDFLGVDYGEAMKIQSDGKILVLGRTWDGNSHFALARYNSDGSLDNSFNGDGIGHN